MRAPRPLWATASGTALARPPAPTSWMSAIGLSSPAAQPSGDHDRLVVAAQALGRVAGGALLEGAEVAAHRGAAELVVERGGADRALEHDLQRGGDARRRAEFLLPGALVAGDAQVRHREAGEPGLGFGAATGGALVADLPARAGGGAGEGRDGGGMIVRLHLHENVDRLGAGAVDTAVRVGEIARPGGAGDDRGVVAVGGQRARGIALGGVADPREQ